jgi:hypothetical protein
MDAIFILHLIFILFFLSIPFWNITYLRYGIFAPILLASIWIIFNGCPLTQIQKDLNDEYFSRVLLRIFYPDISNETTVRISYYILLLVTIISYVRLCPKNSIF